MPTTLTASITAANKAYDGTTSATIATRSLSGVIGELEAANDRLRDEMRLQKRFLASVSHDIRTPLGLIRGYAEAARQKDLDELLTKGMEAVL